MESIISNIWDLFIVGTLLYVIRKGIGEWIYGKITKSERRTAIWSHYMSLAKREADHTGDVTDCNSRNCATI